LKGSISKERDEIEILRKNLTFTEDVHQFLNDLLLRMNGCASKLHELGNLEESNELYKEALELLETYGDSSYMLTAHAIFYNYALFNLLHGRLGEGKEFSYLTLRVGETIYHHDQCHHERFAISLALSGFYFVNMNDEKLARKYYERGLSVLFNHESEHLIGNYFQQGRIFRNLGLLYTRFSKSEFTESDFRESINLFSHALKGGLEIAKDDLAFATLDLGIFLYKDQRYDQAKIEVTKALGLFETLEKQYNNVYKFQVAKCKGYLREIESF
jgi:tetratricopeptide (TPR) repeat protein